MEPLSAVLQKYCLQTQDKLEASRCELFYQKKKLDLSTPVRFANLPKDAKLELVTGGQTGCLTQTKGCHLHEFTLMFPRILAQLILAYNLTSGSPNERLLRSC